MEPIRMVDLKGQYSFIEGEVKAALNEVIESTAFINGPIGTRNNVFNAKISF